MNHFSAWFGIMVFAALPAKAGRTIHENLAKSELPIAIDYRKGLVPIPIDRLMNVPVILADPGSDIWRPADEIVEAVRMLPEDVSPNIPRGRSLYFQALATIKDHNRILMQMLEGPGRPASDEIEKLGSIMDGRKYQALTPSDIASFVNPRMYAQWLRENGPAKTDYKNDYVELFFQYAAKSDHRQSADSVLAATARTNVLAGFFDFDPRFTLKHGPIASFQTEMLIAMRHHMTDASSARRGGSPDFKFTTGANDPYLGAVLDVRHDAVPVNGDRIRAWMVAASADPSERPALIKDMRYQELDRLIDRIFPSGPQMKPMLNFISRAAPFLFGPEFALEAVLARAEELRRDADKLGIERKRISNAQVVLAAADEADLLLTEHTESMALILAALPVFRGNFSLTANRLSEIAHHVRAQLKPQINLFGEPAIPDRTGN